MGALKPTGEQVGEHCFLISYCHIIRKRNQWNLPCFSKHDPVGAFGWFWVVDCAFK